MVTCESGDDSSRGKANWSHFVISVKWNVWSLAFVIFWEFMIYVIADISLSKVTYWKVLLVLKWFMWLDRKGSFFFWVGKVWLQSKEVVSFVNWNSVVGVFEVGVKFYSLQLIEACLALLTGCIRVPQDSKAILYYYWLRFGILFLWDLCPQLLTSPYVS